MSRTVLSFVPEGLRQFLHDLRRDVDDLKRIGSWTYDTETDPDSADPITRNAAQLLCMSTTAESIASGGDTVAFDALVAQYGFSGVSGAGSSWTHPVSGVYTLTYEHAWTAYEDGGTIQLYLGGVPVPEGVLASGAEGQRGRASIAYVADADVVGQIFVTQSSGAAQTCDATVWVALPDPAGATTSTDSHLVTEVIPTQTFGSTDAAFFDDTFSFAWTGGTVYLANTAAGTGQIAVDDQLIMDVTHEDASTSTFTHTFGTISTVTPAGPFDVTSHFAPGTNSVRVRLMNLYPTNVEATEIWLVSL